MDSSDDENLLPSRPRTQTSTAMANAGSVQKRPAPPSSSDDDDDDLLESVANKKNSVAAIPRPVDTDSDTDSDDLPSLKKNGLPNGSSSPAGPRPPKDSDSDSDDDLLKDRKGKGPAQPPDDDSDDEIANTIAKKKADAEKAKLKEKNIEFEDIVRELPAFSPAEKYTATVMKAAKYSKKWVPRFITLDDRSFSYGLDEKSPPKHSFELIKVTRGAEKKHDPFSVLIDGEIGGPKRTPIEVLVKFETRREFLTWYYRLTQPLVHYKMMDPLGYENFPETHPKTGLKFVSIPLEYLHTFAPLDRLCLHFFAEVSARVSILPPALIAKGAQQKQMRGMTGKLVGAVQGHTNTQQKRVVFIGDRMLYLCKTDANIVRCVSMQDVQRVMTVMTDAPQVEEEGGTTASASASAGKAPPPKRAGPPPPPKGGFFKKKPKMMHIAVQCGRPEYDLLFAVSEVETGERFVDVLTTIHKAFSGQEKPLERKKMASLDSLKAQYLNLCPNEFYKLSITLPMSKKYLARSVTELMKKGSFSPVSKSAGMASPVILNASPAGGKEHPNVGSPVPMNLPNGAIAPNDAMTVKGTFRVGGVDVDFDSDLEGPKKDPLSPNLDNPFKSSPLASAVRTASLGASQMTSALQNSNRRASGEPLVLPSGVDPMERILHYVGLHELYYNMLVSKMVDWEVFSCMDAADMKTKGITVPEHQLVIENALNDPMVSDALKRPGGPPPPAPNILPPTQNSGKQSAMVIDDDEL